MESIRNAKDRDLENTAEVEFVENLEFNKRADNVIKAMIEKLKEKLEESDIEKCSAVWRDFVNIRYDKNKVIRDYIIRFEQTEIQP